MTSDCLVHDVGTSMRLGVLHAAARWAVVAEWVAAIEQAVHDTWRADPRTHHEALPVDRGVKYALNIWAHQHDLQTRRGQCAYSGRANVQGGEWADL